MCAPLFVVPCVFVWCLVFVYELCVARRQRINVNCCAVAFRRCDESSIDRSRGRSWFSSSSSSSSWSVKLSLEISSLVRLFRRSLLSRHSHHINKVNTEYRWAAFAEDIHTYRYFLGKHINIALRTSEYDEKCIHIKYDYKQSDASLQRPHNDDRRRRSMLGELVILLAKLFGLDNSTYFTPINTYTRRARNQFALLLLCRESRMTTEHTHIHSPIYTRKPRKTHG